MESPETPMATATTTEAQNTVKLADAGPSCKKLSIEIPAEVVSEKLRDSLDTLSVEAELPGFRKGRVPRWLVEKRFGPALKKEAKTELVATAFNKAVEDLKLKVIGQPVGGTWRRRRSRTGSRSRSSSKSRFCRSSSCRGSRGSRSRSP
jgi:FKBP-type peptidyl-prolyl cis-trans isomerase (trigger factor)